MHGEIAYELQLIVSLSILLISAPFISHLLKLPITVVEISLGSITAFLGLLPESSVFEFLSELGFLYLMFLAGMEVNVKNLLKIDKKIFLLGFLFLLGLYLLTGISLYLFNLSNIFFVILPLISIGLVISVQKEVGKTEWLSLALTIGVLGELISIMILTVVSGVFSFGVGVKLFETILILLTFIALLIIGYFGLKTLFWWFPKIKHSLMPEDDKYYQDIRISFALFFIMIAAMLYLKLDVVLGAFVAGMFIASFFDHRVELEDKLSPLGFGLLISIFFIHIGSTFELSYLVNREVLQTTFFIVSVMIAIRLLSGLVLLKVLKNNEVVLFSLSLSMPLTLLIATATLAYHGESIDKIHYNSFILSAILEVIISMIVINFMTKNKNEEKISKSQE